MLELDFSTVKTFDQIQNKFISVAVDLVSNYDICLTHLAGLRLRITSLELFLYKVGDWEDPTVHGPRYGSEDQLYPGHWYVHRRYKDKYPTAKRQGIDITAGTREAGVYAGLLIRAVNDINGPARVVNSILTGDLGKSPRNWTYDDKAKELLKDKVDRQSIFDGLVSVVPAIRERYCGRYIGERLNLGSPKRVDDERYYRSKLRFSTTAGPGLVSA